MHPRVVTIRSREARLRVSESYREIGERIATLTGNNPLAEVAPAPRQIKGDGALTERWNLAQEEANAANAAALATLIAAIPEKALAKAALATFGHTDDTPETEPEGDPEPDETPDPEAETEPEPDPGATPDPAPATEPEQETPAIQADLIEA